MIEQEMGIELSLRVRKIVFAILLCGILAFACALFFIGQLRISLIVLGVGFVFGVGGALSLMKQSKDNKADIYKEN